jgi:Mn2+/Fe2+ NRAMP family transporter
MGPITTARDGAASAADAALVFEPSPLERLRARGRMRHGIALLASGLSSSSVGTYAGQVASQVVMSFGIPFALVLLTRRPDIMGSFANARATTAAASVVAGLIIALNLFLVVKTFAG